MYSWEVTDKPSKPGAEGRLRDSRKNQEKRIPPKVSFSLLFFKGMYITLNVVLTLYLIIIIDNFLVTKINFN